MNTMAMEYASQCLYLVLMVSLPPILIASLIGIGDLLAFDDKKSKSRS